MRDNNIITASNSMHACLEHCSQAAPLVRPMLIYGERGTGKELIAARLHYLSTRWQQPFIKINCAALSDSLLESELFGHEAGAFTGAHKAHKGRFERAHGGSLFLDEIGCMSAALQEKLLRLVEYGEFERLGGQKVRQIDVRIIAASHNNLFDSVEQGSFRADLLDRLAFDVIQIPALRNREGDIQLLAEHFGQKMATELNWPLFPGFSQVAMATLLNHDWPGNVRELKNAVERSMYRQPQNKEDASLPIQKISLLSELKTTAEPNNTMAISHPLRSKSESNKLKKDLDMEKSEKENVSINLKSELLKVERYYLEKALLLSDFKQIKAAELLKISYHQLRALLKKHPTVQKKSSSTSRS